jgi:Mn-dependent DtxR family transcriptional regulator
MGVRRAGVTAAAGKLREMGLIDYNHGNIQVTDTQGLEATSCECYRLVKEEYDRLLGERVWQGDAECAE